MGLGRWGWVVFGAVVLLGTSPAVGQSSTEGQRLYRSYCGRCHGMDGGGGEGPPINHPDLRRATTDEQLALLIRTGIRGGGMPGSPALDEQERALVVAHVRSLAAVDPEPLSGDPERGARVYEDLGCEACHVLSGVGRAIGPELTRIGAQRGASSLRESVVEPNEVVSDDYLFLRARLGAGGTIEGLRVNEDAFSVQIRDAQGVLHSLEKSDLESLQRLRGRSIMRSYRRSLSAQELDDLVAFLATRRGDS